MFEACGSAVVEAWENLVSEFRSSEHREWLDKAESRYNQSIHKSWFAANALHPRYMGENLTPT